jgi:hypothetical protein
MSSPAMRPYPTVHPSIRPIRVRRPDAVGAAHAPNWPLLLAVVACVAFWGAVATLVVLLALG